MVGIDFEAKILLNNFFSHLCNKNVNFEASAAEKLYMKNVEVKLLVPLQLYHLHTEVCFLSNGKWGEKQRVYPVLIEYAFSKKKGLIK